MSTQVASGKGTSVTDLAWNAIQGAYDLQVHVAPDVIERRIDDVGLAQEFLARGLKGFVLKSHYSSISSLPMPGDQQQRCGSEGQRGGRWVLLDFGDVVVHVFHADDRAHYDLEGLWADAPRIEVE